ncbi:hypothetical protein J437_LFUL017171 [Ladona fulva]|uniref:Uncharacterized protein n=1 Tax=Ladona fulva TaxID=123851 RepID=A0A8K0KN44_LADFU|nr:hypothetical protein J437_LFUL017171 [Ladona fulva]
MPSKPSDDNTICKENSSSENGHTESDPPAELSLTDRLNRKLLSSFLERVNTSSEFSSFNATEENSVNEDEDEFKA